MAIHNLVVSDSLGRDLSRCGPSVAPPNPLGLAPADLERLRQAFDELFEEACRAARVILDIRALDVSHRDVAQRVYDELRRKGVRRKVCRRAYNQAYVMSWLGQMGGDA